MTRHRSYNLLLAGLAGLKVLLPFLLFHPAYGPHRDEYLYWAQGQHPQLGYLENPPGIAVLAAISPADSLFWVRFWPSLFGAATLLIVGAIIRRLGGGTTALLAAATGLLFTAYLRIHALFQPNFLEIFSWTGAFYFLLRLLQSGNARDCYPLAAALALGWWSKYSVLFLIAGFIGALLLSPQRKLLAHRHFWGAVGLGVLLILPNLIWQYSHNWPLAAHMQELQATQLQQREPAEFFKEQLLLLAPVLPVWIGGLVFFWRRRLLRPLFFGYACTLVLLALGGAKGYYALGLYPVLLAGGGCALEGFTQRRRKRRGIVLALLLLISLPFVALLVPWKAPAGLASFYERWGVGEIGLLKWEDGEDHALQQDFADMIGWAELAQKTERAWSALPPGVRDSTVIIAENYGQAGALQWHARSPAFRNRVHTTNGSFLLWIPEPLPVRHLLYVAEPGPDTAGAPFTRFRTFEVVDTLYAPLSRSHGSGIMLGQGLLPAGQRWIDSAFAARRRRFGR